MIHRENCIACGSKKLYEVIDLGTMPNANELVDKEHLDSVKSYHLRFYWCQDCSLVQQLDLADRHELFNDRYTFETGTMPPHIDHYTLLADTLKKSTKSNGFAVVIASNDGTEIELLNKVGGFKKVVGVEPAGNLADAANKKGLLTINKFFGQTTSEEMVKEFGKADLIIANNVFAHIPEPEDLMRGVRNLLGPEGLATIEVQWLKNVVEQVMIDTLYAEHYYEWSIKAMKLLARKCDLTLVDTTFLPDRTGGSVRFWLRVGKREESENVRRMEEEEKQAGLYDLSKMKEFQVKANEKRNMIRNIVTKLNKEGKIVDIWAVPAKVPTILNFSGIDHKNIRYAYDSTPSKMGRYIPLSRIPVRDEAMLNKDMKDPPDYLLIGAWNFLDFAKRKHAWFTARGGKMINLLNGEIVN